MAVAAVENSAVAFVDNISTAIDIKFQSAFQNVEIFNADLAENIGVVVKVRLAVAGGIFNAEKFCVVVQAGRKNLVGIGRTGNGNLFAFVFSDQNVFFFGNIHIYIEKARDGNLQGG